MLNELFGLEARIKIINLFLLHPETKYYISQIALNLKLPLNLVRREIAIILKLGLIINSPLPDLDKKIENKYFEVNKNFILYPEIKALFIKAQILSSQKFILNLEKNFQPKLLILTGFFTNHLEAQTDLLLVGKVNRPVFLKLLKELEKELGREINFTILEEKEFEYRQKIMDIFLYNILEGKTLILIDKIHK